MKRDNPHQVVTGAISDGWVEGSSFLGSILAGWLLGWLLDLAGLPLEVGTRADILIAGSQCRRCTHKTASRLHPTQAAPPPPDP